MTSWITSVGLEVTGLLRPSLFPIERRVTRKFVMRFRRGWKGVNKIQKTYVFLTIKMQELELDTGLEDGSHSRTTYWTRKAIFYPP